ncbi:hypothetical protein D3C73_1421190 [compost metagenome]
MLKHVGGIAFGNQPGLEIEPGRQVPISMAGPRITVDATVLAAPIGIDRAIEGQVR